MAIDGDGKAYIWGQLVGTIPLQTTYTPIRMDWITEPVADIAIGNRHVLILTRAGNVLSFGRSPGIATGMEQSIIGGTPL